MGQKEQHPFIAEIAGITEVAVREEMPPFLSPVPLSSTEPYKHFTHIHSIQRFASPFPWVRQVTEGGL